VALIIITFQDQGQKELEEVEINKNQVSYNFTSFFSYKKNSYRRNRVLILH
jgi:hypothetical protein